MSELLRFEHPPVQEVTLGLMLQSMTSLQTLDLAPLRVEWRAEYPLLQEIAPLARWGPTGNDAVEFVRSGLAWPMALCHLTTESGDKEIKFQQDRFLLTWKFGQESRKYPGFEVLKAELLEKFAQFAKLASEASDSHADIKRVDIQYVNLLPGISAENAMAGVLNGWSTESSFPFRAPDYAGFRVHYHESEIDSNVGVLIGVDSVVSESEGEGFTGSSTLTLDAEALISESADYVAVLESAHEVLTAAFIEVTSAEMRDKWGEIK